MTTYIAGPYFPYQSSNSLWNTDPDAVHLWAEVIEAGLSGMGLIQTADTGQTAASAMSYTASAADWSQFQIWRFNDAAQATDPIFIKIDYGRASGSSGTWTNRIQVGQGSDGAGNLTGVLSGQYVVGWFSSNSSNGVATCHLYACHTAGWACMMHGVGHSSCGNFIQGFWCVERTKDTAGNFDGKGVIIFRQDPSASRMYSTSLRWDGIGFDGVRGGNTLYCVVPSLPTSTVDTSGDKRLYPHWYLFPSIRQNWARFTVNRNEISNTPLTFQATPYVNGGLRTYICMGIATAGVTSDIEGGVNEPTNYRTALLWE